MNADIKSIDSLLSRKMYAEALSVCQVFLMQHGDDIHIIERQADAYKEMGNFYSAIECLDQIIKLNPHGAAAYFRKSRWLFDRGEFDLSVDVLKKVVELDSVYFGEVANFMLAEIFWRKKKYIEAKEALSHVSSDFEVRYMLGYKMRTVVDLRNDIESLALSN